MEHDNGAGSKFYDCIPLAPPYSQALATDAANAWAPPGTDDLNACPGCLARSVTSLNGGAGACGVWCFDSSGIYPPGTVSVNANCLCPTLLSPTWQ